MDETRRASRSARQRRTGATENLCAHVPYLSNTPGAIPTRQCFQVEIAATYSKQRIDAPATRQFSRGQSLFSNLQSQILLLRAGKRVSIKTRCFSLQLIRNKRRRPATSGNFSRVLFRGLRCEDEPRTCDGISANPCRQRAVAARPSCRGSCDCPDRGPA